MGRRNNRISKENGRRSTMEKTIIALSGVGDCGKTETIRLAYDYLRQEGEDFDLGSSRSMEVNGAVSVIKGVAVGFASKGDCEAVLRRFLERLVYLDCDIIVCAAHTPISATYRAVEQIAADAVPPYQVRWMEKPRVSDHDAANIEMTAEICYQVLQIVDTNCELAEA
jgi:hypothetical protein